MQGLHSAVRAVALAAIGAALAEATKAASAALAEAEDPAAGISVAVPAE